MAFLSMRRGGLREHMDDPACDAAMLRRTYAHFVPLNRMLAGWGRVYDTWIRPQLEAGKVSLLDIGCGGGAVLHILWQRARKDGFTLQATGIDPDTRAVDYARTHTRAEIIRCDSSELAATGRRFDIVISNHLLHHLGDPDRSALFRDSEHLARHLAIHADIRRSALGFGMFWWLGLAFPGSFIRRDGLISIRRSYRRAELEAVLPDGWRCHTMTPFRLLAVHARTD